MEHELTSEGVTITDLLTDKTTAHGHVTEHAGREINISNQQLQPLLHEEAWALIWGESVILPMTIHV